MSKFTKGTWCLKWIGNRLFVQPEPAGFDIAELTISSSRPAAMAVANGELMAAAPELLAACEWAARSFHHPCCPIAKGTGQTSITHDDCTCHVGAARRAIAKVKGEA